MDIRRIMMIRPGVRFERMGFGQPLGALSLIACAREKFPGKYEFNLVEQALYDLTAKDVGKRIEEFDPDLVCFSCMSVEGNELIELAAVSKKIKPDVPVVAGGSHASVFWDWTLNDPHIDVVALGEGEKTFLDLLEAYEQDRPLDEVKGIAFRRNGGNVKTPPQEFIGDLDTLPLPAWDLIDFEKYAVQITMNGFIARAPWALLFTSRACPFQCEYCHNVFGKKVRRRSPENVIQELKYLTGEFGIREIHIVDDIFNVDLPRAKRICDLIVENNIDIKIAFPNGLRADMMDRELIQKLKAAGCYTITYAVEAGSKRIQKRINKNLNLEKTKQAIEWTYDEGLIPQAFFMLGFPGETLEEIKQTVDFALENKVLRVFFFMVVVYPRIGLFELAKESYPNFDFADWEMFNLRYWSMLPFYTRVTGIDLFSIHKDAYRKFYLRPRIIFQILWRFPKNLFLLRGLYWGVRATFPFIYNLEPYFRPLRKWLSRNLGIFRE